MDGEGIEASNTIRCIETCMHRFGIVMRSQCGKLMIIPVQEDNMESSVAYHLGVFSVPSVAISCRSNWWITCTKPTSLLLWTIGGHWILRVKIIWSIPTWSLRVMAWQWWFAWLMAVMFRYSLYLWFSRIRIVAIQWEAWRMTYQECRTDRALKDGWISKCLWNGWLIHVQFHGIFTVVKGWYFYCGATVRNAAKLNQVNSSVRFLPKNCTHLRQPCDSFTIQKIKERWTALWEEEEMRLMGCR